MLSLANFTLNWGGTNIEKCNRQLEATTFLLHLYEITQFKLYTSVNKYRPLVNPGAYAAINPKDNHHVLSGRITGCGPVHHNQGT